MPVGADSRRRVHVAGGERQKKWPQLVTMAVRAVSCFEQTLQLNGSRRSSDRDDMVRGGGGDRQGRRLDEAKRSEAKRKTDVRRRGSEGACHGGGWGVCLGMINRAVWFSFE